MESNVLNVFLAKQLIAKLHWTDTGLQFNYQRHWQDNGFAISPHLPLDQTCSHETVHFFLQNLFPEGSGLETLLSHCSVSRSNTWAITRILGNDMPGALLFLPQQEKPATTGQLRPIHPNELIQRLQHMPNDNLVIWDNKPRLSVAGVQHKINVLVDEDGQLAFGEGSLCSTHILKFETSDQKHLVLNEYLSMTLATQLKLPVASVTIKEFSSYRGLLVSRFDRKRKGNNVLRRHIIDGCQALNLPPSYKYEHNLGNQRDVAHIRDGASLPKLFQFCQQCRSPATAKQQLLNWVLFNLIISNWDAHGKNISFFVDYPGISVTPFYDLVNIALYPDYDQNLAMALGDEFDSRISAFQLADFADSCGLPRSLVEKTLVQLCKATLVKLENNRGYLPQWTDEEKVFAQQFYDQVEQQTRYLLQQVVYLPDVEL